MHETHTQMLELRAKDRVEATTLDHIIGTYLAQFVKDVAQETLRAGLLAKRRAEDEVTKADDCGRHFVHALGKAASAYGRNREEVLIFQRNVHT